MLINRLIKNVDNSKEDVYHKSQTIGGFMNTNHLKTGTYLCTLDGQRRTNAIVVEADIEQNNFKVLTDFGNILEMTYEDIKCFYSISESWLEAEYYGYPFPSVKERIEQQILKLSDFKNTLN